MSAADGRLPCHIVCVSGKRHVRFWNLLKSFKYSFTVAPAPRRGWNKFRPSRANFQCTFSFLKTYEITSRSPDGLAPPTAPLKGLAAAFLRMPRSSSLLVQDSNLPPKAPNEPFPPQSPDETIPPKAPMKNYTQKRLKKKQQKKVFFSFLERAWMLPKSRLKGPQQGLAWKPQKTDWMATWSNLESTSTTSAVMQA